MRRGRLVVVSAPSGTGKTTLVERLVAELQGVAFSVSHTTRPPRPGERDGVHYHFVSAERFQHMIDEGLFLEWADVYGARYGTARSEVEGRLASGLDVIMDVDAQGARSVAAAIADAVLVLVLPPSFETLRDRLRKRRTDASDSIVNRLRQVREQLEGYELYKYALVNDDLERAVHALTAVVEAERLVLANSREFIEQLLEQDRQNAQE